MQVVPTLVTIGIVLLLVSLFGGAFWQIKRQVIEMPYLRGRIWIIGEFGVAIVVAYILLTLDVHTGLVILAPAIVMLIGGLILKRLGLSPLEVQSDHSKKPSG